MNEVKLESVGSPAADESRIASVLKEIFLPQGYPDSVHPDYTEYQIWDTVQVSFRTVANDSRLLNASWRFTLLQHEDVALHCPKDSVSSWSEKKINLHVFLSLVSGYR